MNVIVSNKNQNLLNTLDIDVIKSVNGIFSADQIIDTFSNFFFNKMFLDITAIKNYENISNIQKLSMSIDMGKVIFLLDNNLMNDNQFLSKLISIGIYNFANNKESLMYLYNHPNTYKDVAHIHNLGNNPSLSSSSNNNNDKKDKNDSSFDNNNIVKTCKVIGFKNVTKGAGATTLVYMLKKYLSEKDYVVALEVNKNDFGFFNEKDMYSVNQNNLAAAINKFGSSTLILVDLNDSTGTECDEVYYLIEPSIIKLNKMTMINKNILNDLAEKNVILIQSLLKSKDVTDFEIESHIKVLFNLPPLNDREDNFEVLASFVGELQLK